YNLAVFFFSSRRRHTRSKRDWSSDVCSSDLGDVAAHGAVKPVDAQRHAVLGDRGAQDGDVGGAGGGRLQGAAAVGHDQVVPARHKTVDDGGAGVGITLGVLLIKDDAVLAEGFHQGVLEALGGRVQRLVGLLLADADGVAGRGGVPGRRALGGFGLGGGLGGFAGV